MPIAATATTTVASQPRALSTPQHKLAHHLLSRRHQHDDDHDRNRFDSVDDGAPEKGLDRIERGEVEDRADQRRQRDRTVGRPRATGPLGQSHFPLQRLADRVGRAPGQHRHRKQTRADDSERKDREGEPAAPL